MTAISIRRVGRAASHPHVPRTKVCQPGAQWRLTPQILRASEGDLTELLAGICQAAGLFNDLRMRCAWRNFARQCFDAIQDCLDLDPDCGETHLSEASDDQLIDSIRECFLGEAAIRELQELLRHATGCGATAHGVRIRGDVLTLDDQPVATLLSSDQAGAGAAVRFRDMVEGRMV